MTHPNEARRETLANPFRRKRRANQSTRYLTDRQAAQHPSFFDRAGNHTFTQPDRINKQD